MDSDIVRHLFWANASLLGTMAKFIMDSILMPTQKDDESKFETFMKQVLFPNFILRLDDCARDLGISENIVNSLQTIEFWFDDNFGKSCIFKGNAICEKFAEFVYKKVCFEIEETTKTFGKA